MYCLCFIKGVVWVEGKIKLGIVSECMCVGQVQLARLPLSAGRFLIAQAGFFYVILEQYGFAEV